MALQSGLYKSQDQQEQDLTEGPGWTLDDQRPSTFGGSLSAVPRGIGQGVSDGISVLTHGIHDEVIPAMLKANPFADMLGEGGEKLAKWLPGAQTVQAANDALETASDATREYAKTLVGDPRTTGAAANVIQGFSKAATEFTLGSLAGGPEVGAAFIGATEGYAHYNDLLDLGVDEDTAQRSGLTTAILTGGSAVLPMGMPAKWLAGLSTPAALATQAGTGALVNTGFGAVNRYAGAKILRDAGYDTMADQQEVWDKANVLTDAISGAFFGAHIGWHGIKELDGAKIDRSMLDAAKVMQDRQAVIEAAPGIPVDPKSAAVNRDALAKSMSDLLTDKPVDLSEIDTAGAAFARGDVDESAATKIIRDAFAQSDVIDEAATHDWLRGEGDEMEPTSQKPAETPESVKPETAAEPEGYDVGEGELGDEQRKAFGLPALGEAGERSEGAGEKPPVLPGADRGGSSIEGVNVFRGSKRPLSDADFDSEALGHSTGNPTSGTGVWFTTDSAEAARWGTVSEHTLHLENPKVIQGESFPEFDSLAQANAYQRKLIAEGHDGILMKNSHFGGKDHYVAFSPDALKGADQKPIRVGPLADRPGLQIADETGVPVSAADALDKASAEEVQANKEADPMHEAAVACEARHQ
jgi:hypothetical protein